LGSSAVMGGGFGQSKNNKIAKSAFSGKFWVVFLRFLVRSGHFASKLLRKMVFLELKKGRFWAIFGLKMVFSQKIFTFFIFFYFIHFQSFTLFFFSLSPLSPHFF
jgi:hypothetical protein